MATRLDRSHSLQKRLLALTLGAVVSVWLVTAGLTWMDVRHELDELLEKRYQRMMDFGVFSEEAGE